MVGERAIENLDQAQCCQHCPHFRKVRKLLPRYCVFIQKTLQRSVYILNI